MDVGVRTASSAADRDGFRDSLVGWLFLEGDRRVVPVGMVVVLIVVLDSLVFVGVVAAGADSSVAGVFGSGLTAGVVTLVTIALSINQLILSRVFESPGKLTDRLDGSRRLRERAERLADPPSSPNDLGTFLSLLAKTVNERASAALSILKCADPDPPAEVAGQLADVAEYGRSIDIQVEEGTAVASVLGVFVGPEYALHMVAVRRLRNSYGESLPADARAEIQAVGELLESIAVVRQLFNTIAYRTVSVGPFIPPEER